MKKYVKSLLLLALCVAMVMSAFAVGAAAAEGQFISDNRNSQNYSTYGAPIWSHLEADADGFVRVEYDTDSRMVVERYDKDLKFVSRRDIILPLPKFGGVYLCQDANFVVCGQTNYEEDNSKEVIRVIRYTKDWQEVGYASLCGANTVGPFDAGSLRFDRAGDLLFIRTCHTMYRSGDGLNHQANLTMRVRISDMTVLDSFYSVMNTGWGYSSHSFNQFIRIEGEQLTAVDHGDAYPRSIVLFRYTASAVKDSFSYRAQCVDVLPIIGSIGANSTGVSVGGYEYSSTHYLVAGNTIEQKEGNSYSGQRNIFVTATSKTDFSSAGTAVRYLTSYQQGDGVACTTPHLVKLGSDRFILLWGEGENIRYCFLDGAGNVSGDIYTAKASLSECVPIVSGNYLIWYVTDSTYPIFYKLDLNNPASVTNVHTHTYEGVILTEPTEDTAGEAQGTCVICADVQKAEMKAISSGDYELETYWEAGCRYNGLEWVTWKDTRFGTLRFTRETPALGCIESDWVVTVPATCTSSGWKEKTCPRCNNTQYEVIMSYGHNWDDGTLANGSLVHTCTVCAETKTQNLYPNVARIYGNNRYSTAFEAANKLLSIRWEARFPAIVVACGTNFPDALSGTYLAAVKEAPILLVKDGNTSEVNQYIRQHISYGGTLYLLGDKSVVPDSVAANLNSYGVTVKRLGGNTRYDTNLEILKEAGINGSDIIVCTGENFADSLSASAVGKPILLVKDKLSDKQKEFLGSYSGNFFIIGGTGAVKERVENQLKAYGTVKRIGGSTRYETSVLVAKEFFETPSRVVLVYGQNFPDGLSGGPLANELNAPLILTATGKEAAAKEYAVSMRIVSGYVLGGPGLISDDAVRNILSLGKDFVIPVA